MGMDRGVRNGPIRLSHLITTVATTTLLTLLTLLRDVPALYRIYQPEDAEHGTVHAAGGCDGRVPDDFIRFTPPSDSRLPAITG